MSMTTEIKTWQVRMQEFYGLDTRGFKPDEYMIAEIKELRAALAAPAVANAATVELPPLPEFFMDCLMDPVDLARRNEGLTNYARAAIAAAAPNAALVEALQQCLIAFDNIEVPEGGLNGYDSLLHAEAVANAALAAHAGQGAKA